MNAACIRVPAGYCIHLFESLCFELCPEDASWAAAVYDPASCAHWIVAEGWDLLFEPDYQPLEIELLPPQGGDW
jgi:hypothetical protein